MAEAKMLCVTLFSRHLFFPVSQEHVTSEGARARCFQLLPAAGASDLICPASFHLLARGLSSCCPFFQLFFVCLVSHSRFSPSAASLSPPFLPLVRAGSNSSGSLQIPVTIPFLFSPLFLLREQAFHSRVHFRFSIFSVECAGREKGRFSFSLSLRLLDSMPISLESAVFFAVSGRRPVSSSWP